MRIILRTVALIMQMWKELTNLTAKSNRPWFCIVWEKGGRLLIFEVCFLLVEPRVNLIVLERQINFISRIGSFSPLR